MCSDTALPPPPCRRRRRHSHTPCRLCRPFPCRLSNETPDTPNRSGPSRRSSSHQQRHHTPYWKRSLRTGRRGLGKRRPVHGAPEAPASRRRPGLREELTGHLISCGQAAGIRPAGGLCPWASPRCRGVGGVGPIVGRGIGSWPGFGRVGLRAFGSSWLLSF